MDGRFRWLKFEPRDCWPGLVRLGRAGLPSGLLIAVVFSILLNATLVSTLVYPAMMPWSIKVGVIVSTILTWIAGWIDARRFLHAELVAEEQDPQLDLFLSARAEYLQSNWDVAERLLTRLLQVAPDDVEARLMLATLFRHGDRMVEAKEQLRRLQRWRRAAKWNQEIRGEWERIMRRECQADLSGSVPHATPLPDDPLLRDAA